MSGQFCAPQVVPLMQGKNTEAWGIAHLTLMLRAASSWLMSAWLMLQRGTRGGSHGGSVQASLEGANHRRNGSTGY